MHNFSSLLNITLHVSDGLSVHHQESKIVHTASGIILICIRHTVSHNTTIFTMSDGLLHWIKLHVSALGMGHHQVVLRLIE